MSQDVEGSNQCPLRKNDLTDDEWRCLLWDMVECRSETNGALKVPEILAQWLKIDLKEIHVDYRRICEREARELEEKRIAHIEELSDLIIRSEALMERYPDDFALKLGIDSLKAHRNEMVKEMER